MASGKGLHAPWKRSLVRPEISMRPKIQVIQDDLIKRILSEAKQILDEIGIEVRGPALRTRLLDHGLKRDSTSSRILFPPDLVDRAIKSAPRSITLYDRDGNPHAHLGGDEVHFVPGSSGLKVLDHRTGETRLANTNDFVEYVRVADGLSHIDYLATAFSTNQDIEPQVSDAWRLYLVLTNSLKPVVSGAFTERGVPRMAEMMELFRQGKTDLAARPMSIFTITPTGNFRYSEDSSQNLIDCVEWGIPIEIVPVTIMGLIAPVTLVGAAVFHTVDVLTGITMAQIIRPGAPILFGGAPAAFHMKSATSPMAAVEALRLDLAYVAVGKYLGLPTQAYMGLSDSKFLDAQAGAETFGSALLAALAGINSVSGPGMLDYVMVFSLAKLVFDDEVCGQALHVVREIMPIEDIPSIELAKELLNEDHLITSEHTLKHWMNHLHLPGEVIDRQNRENWTKSGERDLLPRAHDEIEMRLDAYTPVDTDPRIDEELRQMIRSGVKGNEPLPEIPEPKKNTSARRDKRPSTRKRGYRRTMT